MRIWSERAVRVACAWLVAVLALVSAGVRAQTAQPTFKPEELEALVAPIALYPDSLLSQVLMASTYPLEIVYAARWVKANPNTKGDAAVKAVQSQPWDVSVKSMVAFPQVLEPMYDKLDWTQKLGDAFLAQEKDVLAAVQRLRAKAHQSGNLKSSEQQVVRVEPATAPEQAGQTVVYIEPANPQTIYVPTYNPTVVYGTWPYTYYPPYYWAPYPAYYPYYPGAAFATGLAWGIGFVAAGAIFGNCNWGGGDVNIDIDRATNIDRNFDRSKVQNGKWNHDVNHRQGVAYRDNATREKFGRNSAGAEGRGDFRGREGAGDRAALGDRGGAGGQGGLGERGGAGGGGGLADRGGPGGDRAGPGGAGDRGGFGGGGDGAGAGAGAGFAGGGGAGGRDSAFHGVGSGGAAQRDFDRGRASTQPSFNRGAGGGGQRSGSFGGGGRGGGGARMGGGRGGGRR